MKTKILILFFVLCLFNVAFAQEYEGKTSERKFSPPKKVSPPVISWISPSENNLQVSTSSFLVQFKIISSEKCLPVQVRNLSRGFVPTLEPVKVVGNEYSYEYSAELSAGKNTLQIFCKNSASESTSNRDIFYKNETPPVETGKYFALLIGVGEYLDSDIPDLGKNPINDATTLRDILVEKYTFNNENVILLTNATCDNIIDALDNLKNKVTPQDNVLIFYAGHGYFEKDEGSKNENDGEGYWIPSDADWNAENPKESSTKRWLYNSQLVTLIKKINSKHTLLISDACFSGSIFNDRDLDGNSASQEYVELDKYKSRTAITSGILKKVPNQSTFFEYLSKNLRTNSQPLISSQELFSKIKNPVINATKIVPKWGDLPNLGDQGGDFIFIKRKK